MRTSFIIFSLIATLSCTIVSSSIAGGSTEEPVVLTSELQTRLTNMLSEAAQLSSVFAVSGLTNPQLLKHTKKVVNGVLHNYLFKFDSSLGSYTALVVDWEAPWIGKSGFQKACIINLTTTNRACSDANTCADLLVKEGTCVNKKN